MFPPIQAKAAQAAMGASNEAVAILKHEMITEHGFVHGMFKSTYPTMNGPALDVLNAKTSEVFR